jgi:hypothetical protein
MLIGTESVNAVYCGTLNTFTVIAFMFIMDTTLA